MRRSRGFLEPVAVVASCLVMCALIVNAAAATKIKVFVMAGQSNNVGYNPPPDGAATLPDSLKQPQKVRMCMFCGNGYVGVSSDANCNPCGCGVCLDGLTCTPANPWLPVRPNSFSVDGWGCEVGAYVSFAHDMAKLMPNDSIAIIVTGCAPATLGEDFLPPSVGGPGPCYSVIQDGVKNAIATLGSAFQAEIAGFMWMQGESDAGDAGMASAYKTNLTALINDLRKAWALPNMPVVIGMITTLPDWGDPATIRKAETDVASALSNIGLVDTKNFPTANGGHYTATGQVMLGNGYATQMMKLLKPTSVQPSPSWQERGAIELTGRGIVVDQPSVVVVNDIRGRTVRSASVNAHERIDLRSMASGAYFVTVGNRHGTRVGALALRSDR